MPTYSWNKDNGSQRTNPAWIVRDPKTLLVFGDAVERRERDFVLRTEPNTYGIPTSANDRAFVSLTDPVRRRIDASFDELATLLQSGTYARVVFPGAPGNHQLFKYSPPRDVRDYIADRLTHLIRAVPLQRSGCPHGPAAAAGSSK